MKTNGLARPLVLLSLCLPLAGSTGCLFARTMAKSHIERGDDALAGDDLSTALAEFEKAVQLDPEVALGHQKLGVAYKQSGQLNKAETSLETAVQLDPLDYIAMFELGEVYRLLSKMSDAIRTYAQACTLRPDDFEPRFRLATAYHETSDFSRATDAYRAAIQLEPDSAQAWTNLGAVYDAQNSYYEAIHAYKRSLECDTNQPVVLVNLATVYLNQDRFSAAKKTLEIALRMADDLSIAHERYGYLLWMEKEYDDAAMSYGRAIEFDPENGRAFAGYGIVRMTQYLQDSSRGEKYRRQAIEAWHRSLEIDPDQPRLRSLMEKYRVRREKPELRLED